MLKISKFATLAIFGALAVNPAFAEEKSVALVNGVSIPQARVDLRVKALVAQGQADSPELRKALRDDMINLEVVVQEANKLGLNKSEEVLQQTELAKQQVLVGAFVQDYAKKHPVSEDQIKQEYDKMKAKLGDKEYNVRHILVETEAEAKSIIEQLGKKAKFEKLAAKSKDTGSAAQGGSLGWAVPSNFVPPFANALLNLKKGERSKDPLQTQFGWHVIMVDDIRDLKAPSLDEIKPQLHQRLQQQMIKKAIDDLRAKAKVE
ncbi:MAG: peptidylprolyl isomerase [Nitrosomonadales bacterium]|nr:peptidylprolyl isomerase [Nitrosomonadales bacterium]